ncbi:MAG: GTP 3',8-cyclase MoaA [bacterium]
MTAAALTDQFGRPIRDLRISVTDRCNFRCTYCMPRDVFGAGHQFLPRSELLSYEEIARVARIFARLGVSKIRVTGGEPLVRHNLESLIQPLAEIPGISDLGLTTNGMLLTPDRAGTLWTAGLKRITISLDALDDKVFAAINGMEKHVQPVLDAIDNAQQAGFSPLKLNMVVIKGVNEQEILPLLAYSREKRVILRFIEFMDVGNSNEWDAKQVFDARQILDLIATEHDIEPLEQNYRGEVARRWKFTEGGGEFGLITSVTQPFCGECSRIRLSAEGKLYTCLFASDGFDLRAPLRAGAGDEELQHMIEALWRQRSDRYSELRGQQSGQQGKIEMSYIGG